MKIISSYPRSGQSKLRFLICNLLYPDIKHDFDTIRKYTPSIDSAEQLNNCADNVQFLFTHSNIRADVYLYRHVGDVLISEYWYKKKYYPGEETIEEFVVACGYGANWRTSVEHGRAAGKKISFERLNNPDYLAYVLGFPIEQVNVALDKCTFEKMAALEGDLGGDQNIKYMRSGASRQWMELECKYDIIRDNEGELNYLDYWRPNDWEGIHL